MDCTNRIPAFQFIPGGALVFSQTYSGDVYVFVLFPEIDGMPLDNNMVEFGNNKSFRNHRKTNYRKSRRFFKRNDSMGSTQ